jgi:hypothetical protein
MNPSPLSEPRATDRLNAPENFQNKRSRSHACRIYCAASETSQGNRSDTSAIADLLIIGRKDFFDLSSVLQFGHGYFVRHRISFDGLSAR